MKKIKVNADLYVGENKLATVKEVTDSITSGIEDFRKERLLYKTFPNEQEISKLENGSYFMTNGFYSRIDNAGSLYSVSSYANNALVFGSKYVKPCNQANGEIRVELYGVRPGESYAASNSNIIESIVNKVEGSTYVFPPGHFYFERPIDISYRQLKISGAHPVNVTPNFNDEGCTWLHFPNLVDGQSAIITAKSSISNVIIMGNPNTYNLSFDRKKTYVDTDNIVTVTTNGAKTCGIDASSHQPAIIKNCVIGYFYTGIDLASSNSTLNSIYIRSCNTGIIASNDIKLSCVNMFNISTGIRITGGNTSVKQLRGDNIAKHLVEVISGSCITLDDIDGDYCLNSLIKLGDGTDRTVESLSIINAHGRRSVSASYNYKTEDSPLFSDITPSTAEKYALVYASEHTRVHGCNFSLQLRKANPLDYECDYRIPEIVFVANENSSVISTIIQLTGKVDLTEQWILDNINSFSTNLDSLEVFIQSGCNNYILKKKNDKTTVRRNNASVIDACDFGLSPYNSSTLNSQILQSLLLNKGTILVSKPGIYRIKESLVIYSNTTLKFGSNVYIDLSEASTGFCKNYGATQNSNDYDIKIEGLNLLCNNNDTNGAELTGMRGTLNFLNVSNLVLRDIICEDLTGSSYGIHIAGFENVLIENVRIYGKKNPIHVNCGKGLTIRHGRFKSYNDPIVSLNAHDYIANTPKYGWIEDVILEDLYDLSDDGNATGSSITMSGGAWLEWNSGNMYRNGDTCVSSDGKVYRMIGTNGDSTEFNSTVEPTHSEGDITYSDGIKWRYIQSDGIKNVGCKNITFRDIYLQKNRATVASINYYGDGYGRSYYPGAEAVQQDNIVFENVVNENVTIKRFITSSCPVDTIKILNSVMDKMAVLLYSGTCYTETNKTTTLTMSNCTLKNSEVISLFRSEGTRVLNVYGYCNILKNSISLKYEGNVNTDSFDINLIRG